MIHRTSRSKTGSTSVIGVASGTRSRNSTEIGMVSPEPGMVSPEPEYHGDRSGVPGTRSPEPRRSVWCPRNPEPQMGLVSPEPRRSVWCPRNPPEIGMVSPEPYGVPGTRYGVPGTPAHPMSQSATAAIEESCYRNQCL